MASFGLETLNPRSTDGDRAAFIDIVVVHGLYGSRDRSWTDVGWHDWLPSFPSGSRLSLYTYDVFGSNGGVLTRRGARGEATKLLDSLLELRREDSKRIAIAFVGHDIGGTLIKAAVILSQQKKYEDVYTSIPELIFLGCPQGGPKLEIQAGCAEMLMSYDGTSFSDAWRLAGPLAEWVLETNDGFAETRLPAMSLTHSVVSSHPDRSQRIFDRLVTSTNLPLNVVTVAAHEVGHRDLLKEFPLYLIPNDWHLSLHRRNLLPGTPPRYPLGVPLDPLFSKDNPQLSLASADIRQWMMAQGAGLWLIHCPGESPAETAAMLHSLAQAAWGEPLSGLAGFGTAFVFDQTDCRYDSAEAMLFNSLTELCYRCLSPEARTAVDDGLKCLDICRRPRREDLYTAFVDIVIQLRVTRRARTFLVVLGNLDEKIRNGSWLFRAFLETVTDCDLKLKVVVTSADPTSLTSGLGPVRISRPVWASSSAASPSSERQNAAKEEGKLSGEEDNKTEEQRSRVSPTPVHKDVLALVQDQPQLYDCIDTLILMGQSCAEDVKLWRLVINWLRLGNLQTPEEGELNGLLNQLVPATPEKVFHLILAAGPSPKRPWFTRALERVLFAFRPLALSEFSDLDELEQPEAYPGELRGTSTVGKEILERDSYGVLMVQRQEVRLAHPGLRRYLETSRNGVLGGWFQLQSESAIHKHLAESCLNYLTCTKTRSLREHRASESGSWHTVFERRDNFLSYAVKYWLRHAMLAAKEQVFETDTCKRFLADEEAVRQWAVLYRALSPPLASQQSGPAQPADALSSLAIFAEHGAQDLLTWAMQKHQKLGTPGFETACFAALVAAAGQGSIRMAKDTKLLENPPPEGETLDQLILAALESDDATTVAETFRLARQYPEKIKDTTNLLARAASLGRTAAVKDLLGILDHSKTTPVDTSDGWSPLSYACQRGFVGVVDLLIREGGPGVLAEVRPDKAPPMPIKLAVKLGRLDIFSCLIASTISQRPRDSEAIAFYRCVIEESSRYGRRKPVQSALADIKRRLGLPSDGSAYDTSPEPTEGDDSADLVDYLTRHIIHSEGYGEGVKDTIRRWEQAYDLLDLLTRANDRLSEEEFSSVFAGWVEEAVRGNDLRVVKLVFENGAESQWATAEVLGSAATMAFRAALARGDDGVFCMSYLIDKGADITSRASNNRTPLFAAAYFGWVKVVEILIAAQVDVNAKGDNDWYPIHACYDNAVITRMLVAQRADVNKLTESDPPFPALSFAARWNHGDVVDELLKGNPSRQTLQAGLREALASETPQVAEKLIPYLPDASYLPDTDTLLHTATRRSNVKVAERLLNYPYRIDADRKDQDGRTALHHISQNTSVEIVKMLVTCGADIEATDKIGETPLTAAVRNSNLEAARYLVEERGGLVTNGRGFYGGPFHTACRHGTLDIVKLLYNTKAGPAEVNRIERGLPGTPLQSALQREEETHDKQAIVRFLVEEAQAHVNLPGLFWGGALHLACLTSTPETMRLLLDHGAVVDVRDHVDRTPLHFALYRTREHVELLLDQGADLDAVDILGRNALHLAVLSGRLDLVQFVLSKRPGFVNQKDAHGWTPLLWALRVSELWAVETGQKKAIIRELLDNGAQRLVRGQGVDRSWTPLALATYYSLDEDVFALLMPTDEDRRNMSDDDREWDWKSRRGKRGILFGGGFCDHCLLSLYGLFYSCLDEGCPAAFCFSCYLSRSKVHPDSADFEVEGEEEGDNETKADDNGRLLVLAHDDDVTEAPLEDDETDEDEEDVEDGQESEGAGNSADGADSRAG